MKKLLTLLILALAIAASEIAQTPPTTLTVAQIREFQALLASPLPCLVYINAGKLSCASLGAGISATANANGVTLSVVMGNVMFPSLQTWPISGAGTQVFTTTSAAVMSQGGNTGAHYLVWRNGVLLNFGADYTESGAVSGSAVTLASTQTTAPGDIVQIW